MVFTPYRFRSRAVLALWILQSGFPMFLSREVWKCSGPETEYTARDCETNKKIMVSENCYFLQHFQQYRPCSAICNDVVFGSIDEDRCRAYCHGMLYFYNKIKPSF